MYLFENGFQHGCFIVGTDTDAGKTVVTAALLRAALRVFPNALAVKAVQTGVPPGAPAPDVAVYRAAIADLPDAPEPVAFESFAVPCSPHLAARIEGRRIDVASVLGRIRTLQGQGFFPIIEAAGGLLVPLDEERTFLDLIAASGLPVLLVVQHRIGCINHALLTLRELRRNGIHIHGVVLNRMAEPDTLDREHDMPEEHARAITSFGKVPVLTEMPYFPEFSGVPPDDAAARLAVWDRAADALRPVVRVFEHFYTETRRRGEEMLAFDREHLWHPYTSLSDPHPVVPVASARGATIFTADGRELIDGMSSWWCAIHGYGHPAITTAVGEQLATLPHVMFGGLTHEPAVDLARKLLKIVPNGLDAVFLADSGSVAVEVAMKMAVQFQRASGKPLRSRFMALRGGYHGDTLHAMSVCDPVGGMHTLFRGVLPGQIFVARPSVPFDGCATKTCSGPSFDAELAEIEAAFSHHADEVAAFILEPVVQGAGGMWFYHPDYLKHIRRLCDLYDILLIADEIATGFGRTGKMFACEWADVHPDILCVGKALTGGFMTLAATLATRRVAEGVSVGGLPFMHGPTFMGNPLACAAARASLELLERGDWAGDVARIERRLRDGLTPCANDPRVAAVRVLGAIGVVEMREPVDPRALQRFFVERGVWIRPFGRLIYLMPPYCASDRQVDRLAESAVAAVDCC